MPAFTLQEAKDILQEYKNALKAVLSAQSYRIGSRELTRANLKEIEEGVTRWRNTVDELEAYEAGRGRRRAFRITPRDL